MVLFLEHVFFFFQILICYIYVYRYMYIPVLLSKFESQHINHIVKNCGKNCVSSPYLLKASLYQFKRVNKTILLKNSFNFESINFIYVVICQECKREYIGEMGCLVKERINICRQHIRQPQYQQLAFEEH